ncbi:uncharacterized protein LOC132927913 [Rhopalosiphum padi]|uniref:uncharacterized protein LOC132927913 n=1 Tax=Rhopalosiphum padi TaxID=40932 RepID=UPI00298EA96B|nr:uncharacterized protein LOC132927913 [Rhopalosiphum padi]
MSDSSACSFFDSPARLHSPSISPPLFPESYDYEHYTLNINNVTDDGDRTLDFDPNKPFPWRSPHSDETHVSDYEILSPYSNDAQSFHWSNGPWRDDELHWKKKILQRFL